MFQMNPARLEPEGFLQSLTPKNLFLVLKAAAAAENSASAFSGTIAHAGHAVAPTPLPLVHLYSLGRVQGHTHTFPKPRGEKFISLTQEWGGWPRCPPSNAASSMQQKQDGLRMTGQARREERLQVLTAGLSSSQNAAPVHSHVLPGLNLLTKAESGF